MKCWLILTVSIWFRQCSRLHRPLSSKKPSEIETDKFRNPMIHKLSSDASVVSAERKYFVPISKPEVLRSWTLIDQSSLLTRNMTIEARSGLLKVLSPQIADKEKCTKYFVSALDSLAPKRTFLSNSDIRSWRSWHDKPRSRFRLAQSRLASRTHTHCGLWTLADADYESQSNQSDFLTLKRGSVR
jgi:hypothetical protein